MGNTATTEERDQIQKDQSLEESMHNDDDEDEDDDDENNSSLRTKTTQNEPEDFKQIHLNTKSENEELNKKNEILEEKCSLLEQKLAKLEEEKGKEIELLSSELNSIKETADQLKKNTSNLLEDNSALKKELDESTLKVTRLNNELIETKEKLSLEIQEKTNLFGEKSKNETLIRQLESDNELLTNKTLNESMCKSDLLERFNKLQADYEFLKNSSSEELVEYITDINKLENQVKLDEFRIKQLEVEINELSKRLDKEVNSKSSLEVKLNELKVKHEREVAEMNKRMENLSSRQDESALNEIEKSHEETIRNLEEKLKENELNLKEISLKFESQIRELKLENERLVESERKANEELKKVLDNANKETCKTSSSVNCSKLEPSDVNISSCSSSNNASSVYNDSSRMSKRKNNQIEIIDLTNEDESGTPFKKVS